MGSIVQGKVDGLLDQEQNRENRLRDGEFKDASPEETVERIKGILAANGIETEERWGESGVPYCHFIRVNVVGTTFGTNGKGLNRAFALASAYGELMERIQLGFLGDKTVQKDGSYSVNDTQSETVPAGRLWAENGNWYAAYARRLEEFTGVRAEPEALLRQFADGEGNVTVTPYYNLSRDRKSYLPAALRKRVYTSNGCAAGNTMEEAVVQAISEIVERNHQWRIMSKELSLPDVPEEVLRSYPAVWEIVSFVRSRGIRVSIKDASLGTGFPVACACFVDGKSGKYHVHYGAYPIFEIALERALTESFQGRSIDNIAVFEDFIYRSSELFSMGNISKELTKGAAEKRPAFFVAEPGTPWAGQPGFAGKNNRELLRECVAFFNRQGYEVLVRDCSCLGFPTCQVIVPGYSEVCIHRLSQKQDDQRYAGYAMRTLRDPAAAQMEDRLGLLMHLEQMKKLAKNVTGVHGFLAGARLSARLSREEELRWLHGALGHVYYVLGKYPEAIRCVTALLSGAEPKEAEYLLGVKRYLSLMASGYDKREIERILRFFHQPETVAELLRCGEGKGNPLDRFVLRCHMDCTAECGLYGACCQRRIRELEALVNGKTAALEYERSAAMLRELLA